MSSRLETLPNELFLNMFIYFDIRDLYLSFWGLNQRINNLLRSIPNLSFIVEKNDLLLIEIFSHQIIQLKVKTSQPIDLTRFTNLQSLELCQASDLQLEQIRSDLMPNLVNLIISSPFHISLPIKLVDDLFSNSFRLLEHLQLSRLDYFQTIFKSQSLSLHSLRITCTDPNTIPQILLACPNLSSFSIKFFGQNRHILPPASSSYNHLLEEFSLDDPYNKLTYETIQILFLYIKNVKSLSLYFLCRVPFIHLIETILNNFQELTNFECEILEAPNNNMVNIDIIQQLNQCFNNLECVEKHNGYRLFRTE